MRTPFGQRLLEAREHAGLKQMELAKAVGMAQSTYGKLEKSGKGSGFTPSIAQKCGVSVMWLANGTGSMKDFDGLARVGAHSIDPLADTRTRYGEEIADMLGQFKDRRQLNMMFARLLGEIDRYRAELLAVEQAATEPAPETHAPSAAPALPGDVAPKHTPVSHP